MSNYYENRGRLSEKVLAGVVVTSFVLFVYLVVQHIPEILHGIRSMLQ